MASMRHRKPWSHGHITIATRKVPHEKVLKAWLKEGLAVHPGYQEPGWTITHAESGLKFPNSYKTATEAKHIADQLLCIEGLWDNPLESFAHGLRETDCTRLNRILGTNLKPGQIGSDVKNRLAYRASNVGEVSRVS